MYRGAITIIKSNESNPPVCKGPTQQVCLLENGTVLITMSFFHIFQKYKYPRAAWLSRLQEQSRSWFFPVWTYLDTAKIEAHSNLTPIVIIWQRLKDENEDNFLFLLRKKWCGGQKIYAHTRLGQDGTPSSDSFIILPPGSVAGPDPGPFWPLDPVSGIGFFPAAKPIFWEFSDNFLCKLAHYFSAPVQK